MPAHHDVRAEDVDLKRLGGVLATAYESNPENYESHGQGLRLAAKIVKVHNGSIRFRSEPGEYFETEARIPVIQKQAAD